MNAGREGPYSRGLGDRANKLCSGACPSTGLMSNPYGGPRRGVQITFLTPFPSTPLYERLQGEGRILHEGAWELCTLFDVNFRPERMSVRELEQGFRALAEKLYSEEAARERRRRFRRKLLALRRHQKSRRSCDGSLPMGEKGESYSTWLRRECWAAAAPAARLCGRLRSPRAKDSSRTRYRRKADWRARCPRAAS
jgi:hypothetical protein